MIIVILAFALLLHLIEAEYEAKVGDKNHWPSITISFCFNLIFTFFVGYDLISGSLLWASVRAFFDFMYNYFKGMVWKYLGSSKTDKLLKGHNPYLILVFRVLFSLLCITIALSR